jgi:hypothetical protein
VCDASYIIKWIVRWNYLTAGILLSAARFAQAGTAVIYDDTYNLLPPNVPSLGYQATGTSEFGDLVQFTAGSSRILAGATAVMSNWAYASEWSASGPGYLQLLTLNLYDVDSSSGTPQPGALIASSSQTFLVPWRPEPDPNCPGTAWKAADGSCYNGFAFEVHFDFNLPVLPDTIIYGLAYNTQTYGNAPYGVTGPYNSLNFGVNTTGPSLGSRPLPDTAYWSSTQNTSGTGFVQDTGWTPYSGAIRFEAETPEPGAAGLVFAGAVLIWIGTRRRSR